MVLMNMSLFLAAMVGKLIQRIFFGPLRTTEIEHLYERTWYSITETCLAMTIFRNNFDTMSIIVFVILIFLKTFHWLCLDRLEFTQQSENTIWRFHTRIIISIISLLIFDIIMTRFSIYTILNQKPNMMLMFAFEFAILTSTIIGAAIKYTFNLIDSYHNDNWENKGLYVLYLELFLELFKLIAYTTFFMLALTFYGLPLHIIRDVYITLKSFLAKCRDLIRYKRVTNNMNQRFVDATLEEITATEDKTCIICREEMVHSSEKDPNENNKSQHINNTPKKLPCNHILHFNCLKSWLERQQSCPTCRRPVLEGQSQEIFNINRSQILHFLRNFGRRNNEVSNRDQRTEQNRNPVSRNTTDLQNPQNIPLFHNNYRLPTGWTIIPLTNQDICTIHNAINNNNSDTFFNNNLGNTDQNKQTNTDSSLNKEKGKKSIDSSCTGSISSSIEYSFPEKLSIININTQKSSANTIYAADLNSTKFDSALLNASNIRKVEESNKLLLQAQEKILQSLQILNTQGQLQKNIEINDSSNTAKISNKLNENIPQVEKKNHDQ
ncbi:uncharacterized protein T551_00562 [Pneumocystis jirovecii RU7]|uniref:RING-type E3 ubiquitin transferase n=1 Tax=Pneumocystis jirovecii (strain RU7) TaxID=1408657 RepID=A0A0W4ZVS2_PNEJ7|nr:uncharacterized protein T551_00562 [Pneumocystis jirovecii RU7]KTW32472.1 hypothetical protein T551_00562 [Pneumocystis jirovecii RU7]